MTSSRASVRRLPVGYFGLSRGSGKRRTSWRALHNRSFRYYFTGSVTSDFGTWLQNTAQVLLAYRLSHSVAVVGLVSCAQFSSPLVLGPWAGVMTDRFGGRRRWRAQFLNTLANFPWIRRAEELLVIAPQSEIMVGTPINTGSSADDNTRPLSNN